MKVAIIGAGISGLSCAVELRRHGITPVIFEKSNMLGDVPGYLVATLRLFHRSLRSPMVFFRHKYGISLAPLHPIKEMVMIVPNRTVTTKANHGYIFKKGIEPNSLEHQIAAYLDIPIEFGADIKIQDVKNAYDHIVVANGGNSILKELNLWTTTFMAVARIATIEGKLKQDTMLLWLNKIYAKNGNGYLLAKNDKEGELVLAVSDITMNKLDYYWNEFLIGENLTYAITGYNDVVHEIGYPSTNQYENLFFSGNCGGMIDDFLGFGMTRAFESGILAARAIVYSQDYNKLLKPFKKEVENLAEYRKMMNVLDNKNLDKDMSIIGVPVLKQMIYNNPLYKAKYGVLVPKMIAHLKKKEYPFKLYQRK